MLSGKRVFALLKTDMLALQTGAGVSRRNIDADSLVRGRGVRTLWSRDGLLLVRLWVSSAGTQALVFLHFLSTNFDHTSQNIAAELEGHHRITAEGVGRPFFAKVLERGGLLEEMREFESYSKDSRGADE